MTDANIDWRTSSFSNGGTCVEIGEDGGRIAVRNSVHPDRGTVYFTRDEMAAWIAGCKAGEFDDLT